MGFGRGSPVAVPASCPPVGATRLGLLYAFGRVEVAPRECPGVASCCGDARALIVAECGTVVLCAPYNFARNLTIKISIMCRKRWNINDGILELEICQGELRATFGVLCLVSVGGGCRRCLLCRCWLARMRIGYDDVDRLFTCG